MFPDPLTLGLIEGGPRLFKGLLSLKFKGGGGD
jgi:hypothetical protein